MKKLLTLLLVLALFLPAAATAGEEDIIGTSWAHSEIMDNGAPYLIMFYLGKNHLCYYVSQKFTENTYWTVVQHVGSWNIRPDGTVWMEMDIGVYRCLSFNDFYEVAMDQDTNELFYRVFTRKP